MKKSALVPSAPYLWFVFCRWLVRVMIFQFSGGVKGIGRENVPMKGPVIIAPVHVSHLDPPAIACSHPRQARYMAKEELFANKWTAKLIRSLGAFPVKRGEGDTESMRVALEILNQGMALVVFPEGTRGEGKTLQALSRGVAVLAKKTNAIVVPAGISGTHERLPMGQSKLKKGRVTVEYGKPFTYTEIATSSSEKENREIFSRHLSEQIVELCNRNGFPIQLQSTETNEPS